MSESIHQLEKEIHTSSNKTLFSNDHFADRIGSLTSSLPTSQNYNLYAKIIQELNRKYHQFGLISKISTPVDAGFRPTNLTNSFGGVSTPGLSDNILTENSSILVQENGFNLVLEQDV